MKDADPFPFVKRAFETIALAKVATSAEEAREFGFLRDEDSISMNADRLIADAKKQVLALAAAGYVQPQQRKDILALGYPALGDLKLGVHLMKRAGYISDHDALIGEKLARILTGGDLNHRDARQRAVLLESRTRSFPFACRHAQDAGSDCAHAEDREAVRNSNRNQSTDYHREREWNHETQSLFQPYEPPSAKRRRARCATRVRTNGRHVHQEARACAPAGSPKIDDVIMGARCPKPNRA